MKLFREDMTLDRLPTTFFTSVKSILLTTLSFVLTSIRLSADMLPFGQTVFILTKYVEFGLKPVKSMEDDETTLFTKTDVLPWYTDIEYFIPASNKPDQLIVRELSVTLVIEAVVVFIDAQVELALYFFIISYGLNKPNPDL